MPDVLSFIAKSVCTYHHPKRGQKPYPQYNFDLVSLSIWCLFIEFSELIARFKLNDLILLVSCADWPLQIAERMLGTDCLRRELCGP